LRDSLHNAGGGPIVLSACGMAGWHVRQEVDPFACHWFQHFLFGAKRRADVSRRIPPNKQRCR